MVFNLEVIPFMNLNKTREFYEKLSEIIPKLENYEKYLEYFEETWLPKNDNDKPYYEFDLLKGWRTRKICIIFIMQWKVLYT